MNEVKHTPLLRRTEIILLSLVGLLGAVTLLLVKGKEFVVVIGDTFHIGATANEVRRVGEHVDTFSLLLKTALRLEGPPSQDLPKACMAVETDWSKLHGEILGLRPNGDVPEALKDFETYLSHWTTGCATQSGDFLAVQSKMVQALNIIRDWFQLPPLTL